MPFVTISQGRIQSIKMEYNLVEGCNYACRECSHFSPHMRHKSADLGAFAADIDALRDVYRARRFRFVGGEPFLHQDVREFIGVLRRSGLTDKIEVVTNGSLLRRVDDAVLREIDILSVSWYADKRFDETQLDRATDRCRRLGTRLKVRKVDEFRMMQLDDPIQNERLRHDIYASCQIAHTWYCQTFYEGYFYLCSRPIFTDAYLDQRGRTPSGLRRADGVALHEPDLIQRLLAYLARSEPLESCSYCLGTVGKRITWQQMSAAERKSTTPLGRSAETSLSRTTLRYLLAWALLERAILRIAPSLWLARALHLVKEAVLRA